MTAFGSSASGTTISASSISNRNPATPRQPLRHRVVTHVLGTFRYLCLRSGQMTALKGTGIRTHGPRGIDDDRDSPFCLCGTSLSAGETRLVSREGPAVRTPSLHRRVYLTVEQPGGPAPGSRFGSKATAIGRIVWVASAPMAIVATALLGFALHEGPCLGRRRARGRCDGRRSAYVARERRNMP
jgi:hypothetical protein